MGHVNVFAWGFHSRSLVVLLAACALVAFIFRYRMVAYGVVIVLLSFLFYDQTGNNMWNLIMDPLLFIYVVCSCTIYGIRSIHCRLSSW